MKQMMYTSVKNVGSKAKHGAYAFFPGTGPAGQTCASCTFYTGKRNKDGIMGAGTCRQYSALTGTSAPKIKPAQACKYFTTTEERKANATHND